MRSAHSFSAYSAYLRCPPTYRLCYLDGDPGITPDALKNGSLNHDAIARYAAHCFGKQRKMDLEEGRRIALGYQEPVRGMVEKFVEAWRFEWGTTIVEGIAPVEQEFTAALPGGQIFSGHIDLLQKYEGAATVEAEPFGADDQPGEGDEALWVVTDFKSGFYGDVWDEENAPFQQRIYPWLVQQNYPQARSFESRLYSIRTNYTLSWKLGGDLSYIGHELQALADRIAAEEEWEANPGPACLTCLHIHACPLKDTETVRQITSIDPNELLRLQLWHEAQKQALASLLKAVAEHGGRPQVPGWVYEGRAATSLIPVDRATFPRDCVALGIDPEALRGNFLKSLIEKAAKTLEEGKRDTFLGLLQEKPTGKPVYKAYQNNGKALPAGAREGEGGEDAD